MTDESAPDTSTPPPSTESAVEPHPNPPLAKGRESEPTPTPSLKGREARPAMSTGQKMFLRFSGVLAMALFLLPTFYVVKYFALDSGRENDLANIARTAIKNGMAVKLPASATPDELPMLAEIAREGKSTKQRVEAIDLMGGELQRRSLSFERPMECVLAKSMLADIAAHDTDAAVRSAAQDEIGKIAQSGVVVRR